uniref:Uncharacterized protein n=1 Tax=Tetraodon nigroviridis TaxID=99883 RepID=H3BYV3_TETNG
MKTQSTRATRRAQPNGRGGRCLCRGPTPPTSSHAALAARAATTPSSEPSSRSRPPPAGDGGSATRSEGAPTRPTRRNGATSGRSRSGRGASSSESFATTACVLASTGSTEQKKTIYPTELTGFQS